MPYMLALTASNAQKLKYPWPPILEFLQISSNTSITVHNITYVTTLVHVLTTAIWRNNPENRVLSRIINLAQDINLLNLLKILSK